MGFTDPKRDPTPPVNPGPSRPAVGAARFLPASLAALLAGIAILPAGCGGGGGTDSTSTSTASSAPSGPAVVEIVDYIYKPAQITVPAGTTVEFTNQDSTPHTATSKRSGVFETGSIDTGKTGEVTLEEPGTYAYFCAFHPFMKGTITVK